MFVCLRGMPEFDRDKVRKDFDEALKRPIPRVPHRIGVITSSSGAAIHDILTTLQRRFPLAPVDLYPVPVQGEDAPPAIVRALRELPRRAPVDVVILARGGGSLEDLWAFNDERVARAIRACTVPVVCGVGHEVDVTIADFAADLRAPTPTAAAEMAVPVRADLIAEISAARAVPLSPSPSTRRRSRSPRSCSRACCRRAWASPG